MAHDDYDSYEAAHDKPVRKWLGKLAAEKKEHQKFRDEAEKALKVYERQNDEDVKTVFPMYTANVDILHAALFSKLPAPDVRRPHQDQGDKNLAKAIQRAIEHLLDTEDYAMPAHRSVTEWLAGGLGVLWLRYAPEVVEMPVMQPVIDEATGQPVIGPDGEPMMEALRDDDGKLITESEIESQTITLEYHPYHRFRWEPTVVWEDVDWISFDYIKTTSEIESEYDVTLNNATKDKDRKAASADDKHGHIVHHIWCKKSRTIKVVTPAHKEFLAEYDDPLGLEHFYPFPRPLMMNVQSGEMTPRPDFCYIETQHDNLQELTKRINALTKGIKDVGFYEASVFEEFGALENAPDGKYIGVENLLERMQGNNTQNVLFSVDNTNKVETLDKLRDQREGEKNIIYELQGIADIVRGASVASETATAQAIKDKHFQVRLSEKINELRRYWRDLYRLMTEIIGEHFTPESFFVFSGVQLDQNQLMALKNELGRSYMIDVETEDTTFADDEKERQQGIELIRTMGEILGQHLPAVQSGAMPADFLTSMLQFGTNLFKHGAVLEDGIASLPSSSQQYAEMQQAMQQMQGQIEELGQQNQQLQEQLGQVQQQEEARKNVETQADAQSKAAEAQKDAAEAQQTQIENAQMVRFGGLV